MVQDQSGTVESEVPIIYALGASAGGLAPLEEFFDTLRSDLPVACVVIQHLSPDHESMMVSLLERHTEMSVTQAADGSPIEPGCVYLIPPNTELRVEGGTLRLTDRIDVGLNVPRPIDTFFTSMAEECGPRCVGVVLSGTGSDGAEGLRLVHALGGLCLAQDGSALFSGMPTEAISTGVVDAVLRPSACAEAVSRFVATAERPTTSDRALLGVEHAIVDLVSNHSGIDFSLYKPGTIRRRIHRRQVSVGAESLDRFADLLRTNAAECEELAQHLLIDVTEFARDPAV